jgi:hypothetical protein
VNGEKSQPLVPKRSKVDLVNMQVQTKSIDGDQTDPMTLRAEVGILTEAS